MDVGRFFSIKDFFNYYVAGAIWLLDLALALLWFSDPSSAAASLDEFKKQINSLGPLASGVLIVVLPYVTGFTLNPFCNCVSRRLCRIKRDPMNWVTDYGEESSKRPAGKRLVKPAVREVSKLASETFDYKISDENQHLWFFQVRAYVINKGGAASDLATRACDLMNFAESLLLPVPLLSAILIWGGLTQLSASVFTKVLLLIAGLVVSFIALAKRYLRLREYWVKHTYRAFLVMKAHEQQNEQGSD